MRLHVRPSRFSRTIFARIQQSSRNHRSIHTTSRCQSILGLEYSERQSRTGQPIIDPQTLQPKLRATAGAIGWSDRYQARRDIYPLGIPRGPTTRQLAEKRELERRNPRRIKIYPPTVSSARARCRDPIAAVTSTQLAILDPTGARTKLFNKSNTEAARVGDILLVRSKDGDPFAGVCINIRRRGVDTAILLRDTATRVGVEMWFKIYSPNIEGIEVAQRKTKRARRARLYYMRQPKHDFGSVHNAVQQYLRQRSVLRASAGQAGGRDGRRRKKR